MFKGILPKRGSYSDFTMVTAVGDTAPNGKENNPEGSKRKSKSSPMQTQNSNKEPPEAVVTEQAFDKLLDDLQIPDTLRPKLATMESSVKAAMIKSSRTLSSRTPTQIPTAASVFDVAAAESRGQAGTTRMMRHTRSSESLDSPRKPPAEPERPRSRFGVRARSKSRSRATSRSENPSSSDGSAASHPAMHARGVSFQFSRGSNPFASQVDLAATAKGGKEKDAVGASFTKYPPVKVVSTLLSTSSTILDVEVVKKLRLLLRNESASWTEEFLARGGYEALLTRLNELLEVEWREEQHDDQLLHAILLCLKGLGTSSIGCCALRSASPAPWTQLMSLLYSDKKPGDVACRQVIVELVMLLFDLYPASALPSSSTSARRTEAWESSASLGQGSNVRHSKLIHLPAPHASFFAFIRALLLTPAPRAAEAPEVPVSPHDFIESLHKPRLYKTFLQELSDVCRDYFWVFCHPNNTIWNLSEVDEARVEKPRAPGGMTGGVEFEAVGYMTLQFKLINAIAQAAHDLGKPKEHELSAHQFHADLFLSGIERILLIARKASATYYPTLHLEISRYVAWAGRAGFEMPWTLSRLVGLPPTGCCKPSARPPTTPRGKSSGAHKTPRTEKSTRDATSSKPSVPSLPAPKIDPIKF
ncbi:hypothetical protein PUNSTDRAFT_86614 [Punctularia strigosozonata HHB-11173 SS5]|uniref:uncharacterized protein n=1 Tax=Punctularia strigosozonata (strain HHB-11173) TaxID=741275 RepID=UPI00044165E5|nr:uncharacterized protein PUNSTDRAFT_86614 [Punctularia strigosozonata HHB-11173 SS5]EIN10067.1 hypothetical protein PUNSTDRAFT_86614 [Punctularia strigosozonata HHB-11173 SS5]